MSDQSVPYIVYDGSNIALQPVPGSFVAWDIETSADGPEGTRVPSAEPRDKGFRIDSLGIDAGTEVWIFEDELVRDGLAFLRRAEEAGVKTVGHNATWYDRMAVAETGGPILKPDDTMLLHYLLREEGGKGARKLEHLAVEYLGVPPWKADNTYSREYLARDCRYTRRLYEVFISQVQNDAQLVLLYEKLLLPASRALSKVNRNGVYISLDNLTKAEVEIKKLRDEARAKLVEIAKGYGLEKFNPRSNKQLGVLLYEKMKLPILSRTKGGAPQANELVLKSLIERKYDKDEFISTLLTHRENDKLINTYLDKYRKLVDKIQRLYPSYSLTYTVTGRTSAFKPNIQQIPNDPRVRAVIAAPPGKVLVLGDLSQIELRIAAWVAGAEKMKQAYRDGVDIHQLMGSYIAKVPLDQVTSEIRRKAKPANFGYLYGADPETFINYAFKTYDVRFTLDEAQEVQDAFFAMAPELQEYYKKIYEETREKGFVRSPLGRIRRLPDIRSGVPRLQLGALRQAINFPIQSFASDICLIALILATAKGYTMVMEVHDMIAAEVEDNPEAIKKAVEDIRWCMEVGTVEVLRNVFHIDLDIPIKSDISVRHAWTKEEKGMEIYD